MARHFYNILNRLATPLLHELPFFIIFFVLIGMRPFYNIYTYCVEPDLDTTPLDLAGRVAIVFTLGYVFTLLVDWIGKRWFKILAYAVVLAFFTVDLFLLRSFGMMLRPNVLMLLSETNGGEASEFVRLFLLTRGGLVNFSIVALAILAIMLAERAYHRKKRASLPSRQGWLTGLLTGLLLLFGLFSCTTFVRLLRCDDVEQYFGQQDEDLVRPTDPMSSLVQSIYGIRLMRNEMATAIATNQHIDRSIGVADTDSLNVVLVIGESHSKWHSSIYGYPLPTNPLLEAERDSGNLFVFDDAVTPFCITSPSMKNMLCCNSVSHGEPWWSSPYIPTLFKAAGYNVFFWDNQRRVSPNALYTFALNSFLYNDTITHLSYTATNKRSHPYDYTIVYDFANSHAKMSKHNFIVFHLLGQHFIAGDRYPHTPQFDRFNPDSITLNAPYLTRDKKEYIAQYDNATLYNDYVLKRIFDLFRQQNTVVVYLSDHGEENYDYRDSMARYYTEMDDPWLKYVHEVPFVVWCSERFKATHPDVVRQIAMATHRPFTTDNLCHLLFHLGGLQTKYYKPERDIISEQFKPYRRIVEGKNDYLRVDFDSIRKR